MTALANICYRQTEGRFYHSHTLERLDYPHGSGYMAIQVDGQPKMAHLVAWKLMTSKWPEHLVDHVDQRKQNNIWTNLRAANHSLNGLNTSKTTAKSGFLGVVKHNYKWRARIRINGVLHSLGSYDTPEEAAAVVQKRREETIRSYE